MKSASESFSFTFFGSLVYLFSSVPAESQVADVTSVPEPTQLHTAALAERSNLIWSELLGEIQSADARAEILAIEVEGPDGERVLGEKISFENSTAEDQLYITDTLLPNLRYELADLESESQVAGECQAKNRYIRGIARCRPSRTVKQAYCPSHYSAPNSGSGMILSTPRHSFSFPSIGAAQFETLISEAVKVLE